MQFTISFAVEHEPHKKNMIKLRTKLYNLTQHKKGKNDS